MNGVEILASNEVIVEKVFNWNAFLIAFCITFAFFLVAGVLIASLSQDKTNIVVGIILGIIFGFLSGTLLGDSLKIPTAYESQYKVAISDEVSMNDFLEKYEIIDQEGKIYTIRERQ